MFKQSRFFISVTLITTFFVSTLILSSPTIAQACPPPPESLFSLYMKSQLVVLAEVKNETDVKTVQQYDDASTVEVKRELEVIETFKGEKSKRISFVRSEYRPKEQPVEDGQEVVGRVIYVGYSGRNIVYNLSVGNRYLFFLNKVEEPKGSNSPSYQESYQGIRNIDDQSAALLKTRFGELKAILDNEKNQAANFAEWLVRLIEEPETRWDGAYDLSRSFYALEYEDNNPSDPENQRFSLKRNFSTYASEIARQLTDSQKERISSILYGSLSQPMSETDDETIFDHNLIRIVSYWDKSRLAMYAFGLLQTVDRTDFEKTVKFMGFVANVAGDEELYAILSNYHTGFAEEETEEIIEEEEIEYEASEAVVEITELQTDEIEVVETEESAEVETVGEAEPETIQSKKPETKPEILTPAQIREKLFQDFVGRYQYLLARNFEAEKEEGLEQIAQK